MCEAAPRLTPVVLATQVSTEKAPAYSKVMVYVDGKPYPRAGHNTLTYTSAVEAADTSKTIKLHRLSTRVQHTVVLVLATDKGPRPRPAPSLLLLLSPDREAPPVSQHHPNSHQLSCSCVFQQRHDNAMLFYLLAGQVLGVDKLQFKVSYTGGCALDAADNECGAKGVCHSGYCVCFDGYFGLGCENTFTETSALAAPTTCVSKTSGKPMAHSCMVGGGSVTPILAGRDCHGTTAAKCVAFKATDQFRARMDAGLQDGISSTHFVNSMQRAESTAQLVKSTAAALVKKGAIQGVLESEIFDKASRLATNLATATASTATKVEALRRKEERNAIAIQQARLESARLAVANKEQWLDSKRSLYAEQTGMQNRLDSGYQINKITAATWAASAAKEFKEAHFLLNQAGTANGPRVKIDRLKKQSCTTDQFFRTTCTAVDSSAAFVAADDLHNSIPR